MHKPQPTTNQNTRQHSRNSNQPITRPRRALQSKLSNSLIMQLKCTRLKHYARSREPRRQLIERTHTNNQERHQRQPRTHLPSSRPRITRPNLSQNSNSISRAQNTTRPNQNRMRQLQPTRQIHHKMQPQLHQSMPRPTQPKRTNTSHLFLDTQSNK